MRRKAGFTLLELVLVLVLLGTLSAILAAHFPKLNFTFESEFMECESRLREAVVFARNQQLMYQDGDTSLTISKNSATCKQESSNTLSLTIYESGYIGRTLPEEEGHEN